MYRELKKRGVQIVFHSYHNGHKTAPQLRRSGNIWAIVVPAVMQAYAANNALWVSAANTTRRQSCWGSFVVRPDGRMVGRLPRHRAGLLLTTVDTRRTFYDPSEPWRGRAMRGIYHSGRAVDDPRSRNRTAL
jgi:predicted amidohydrolase